MEIKIGIRGVSRELSIDTEEQAEELAAKVTAATETGSPLVLKDDQGRTFIVPARSLGYIEIGTPKQRRVGFGV